MTATATKTTGELVASTVAGANEALHLGHLLYAAEIQVTAARGKNLDAYPARMRQRLVQRLNDAVEKRNRLDSDYRDALAAVRTTDPATSDLIDDAVWRIHLIDTED